MTNSSLHIATPDCFVLEASMYLVSFPQPSRPSSNLFWTSKHQSASILMETLSTPASLNWMTEPWFSLCLQLDGKLGVRALAVLCHYPQCCLLEWATSPLWDSVVPSGKWESLQMQPIMWVWWIIWKAVISWRTKAGLTPLQAIASKSQKSDLGAMNVAAFVGACEKCLNFKC